MRVRIVQMVDGSMVASETTTRDLEEWMIARGARCTGISSRPSLRQELQGQPKFEGFHGPMWGGDHLRYEDFATTSVLSS